MSFEYNKNVYLDIRQEKDITDQEKELLKLSKLEKFGKVEIWSACGTNQQLAYCTHGAFRYFGKFPPPIATYLIKKYTKPGDLVFDPMCGSGTTGVEALLLERNSLLNDINPLSTLLTKVKTTKLNEKLLIEHADEIYKKYKPLSQDEYDFLPEGLKNYEHWFLPETIESLRGIKKCIESIKNNDIKDFYNICFASTIRRVSRATTQQGRLFLDVETAEKDALETFKKKVNSAIKGMAELPNSKTSTKIISSDLRQQIPEEFNNIANLIICHPPYFNSYKYSSINSLELSWLGFDYSQIRKNEVREFFKVGKEENVDIYVDDMVNTLINLHPTLIKNSRLALMIGDTVIHNNYIPVTSKILERLSKYYKTEIVALRVPKFTEAAWVASQRRHANKVGVSLCDFVIVLRKKNVKE